MSEWQGHLLSCSGQLKINCKTVKYLYTSLVKKIINILHGAKWKDISKYSFDDIWKDNTGFVVFICNECASLTADCIKIQSKIQTAQNKISLIARKVNIRYRLRLRVGHFSRLWVPSKKLWSNFESRIRGPWLIFSHVTGCWRCLTSLRFSFQLKLSLLLVRLICHQWTILSGMMCDISVICKK